MAYKRPPILPGKVVGCARIKAFMQAQTPEQREWYLERIKSYPHLYPCPKAGGNWGYKEDCRRCSDAIREKT